MLSHSKLNVQIKHLPKARDKLRSRLIRPSYVTLAPAARILNNSGSSLGLWSFDISMALLP